MHGFLSGIQQNDIYFHRALNVWLQNTEILPKQKGVLPFSKVVTFTLKTLEFSRKLSILLQFKTIFRPVTKSKWGTIWTKRKIFIEKWKIMKITDFNEIGGKYQIFQWNTLPFSVFAWKITIFMKIMKNIKFSNRMQWYLLKNYSFHEK